MHRAIVCLCVLLCGGCRLIAGTGDFGDRDPVTTASGGDGGGGEAGSGAAGGGGANGGAGGVGGSGGTGGDPGTCIEGDNGASGYRLCSFERSWTDAQQECITAGFTDLVILDDELESLWFVNRLKILDPEPFSYWIGLSDSATEGTFLWNDGSTPAYYAFRNSSNGIEPDNNSQALDCVESRPSIEGDWAAMECDPPRPAYACEGATTGSMFTVSSTPPSTCMMTGGYLICTHQANWLASREQCEAFGMSLLKIDDATEQAAVEAALPPANPPFEPERYWIGLNDLYSTEGDVRWTDGTAPTYTNYGAAPNTATNNCVELRENNGRWIFLQCRKSLINGFICE